MLEDWKNAAERECGMIYRAAVAIETDAEVEIMLKQRVVVLSDETSLLSVVEMRVLQAFTDVREHCEGDT